VMTVEFELDGQHFVALNGGPQFKFDEAISFQVLQSARICSASARCSCFRLRATVVMEAASKKLSQLNREKQCHKITDRLGSHAA